MRINNSINVLLLYNIKGWAWWHKAHQIKKNICRDIKIHIKKLGSPIDHTEFDFVLTFNPISIHPSLVPSFKLITGCSSPFYLREFFEFIDSEKCLAGFVNSLEQYIESKKSLDQVYLCQNGVDIDLFTPCGNPPKKLTACWIGDSTSKGNKGIDLIKASCEKVGIQLLFVDRQAGKEPNRLLSLQDIRDQIYYRSTFYICASELEATPNPALEALACGLPVISTKVGNMPEIIIDGFNGYLVERTVESIVAAIEKIRIANLSNMRNNARISILNGWTWKQQVKKYERMFLELFQKKQDLKKNNQINEAVDPLGLLQLARAYHRHNKLEKAEQTYNKLLSLKNTPVSILSNAHYFLAEILETQGKSRWKWHLEESNHLLISLENLSDVQSYRVASVLKRLKQLEGAEAWFQKVLDSSDKEEIKSGVLFHLGEIFFIRNDLSKSREYFERCLELNPGHKLAQRFLVRVKY